MSEMAVREAPERKQRALLERLYSMTELTTIEFFRNFPVYTPRFNLARFLTHCAQSNRIVAVPSNSNPAGYIEVDW